jgi:hypothetical protein
VPSREMWMGNSPHSVLCPDDDLVRGDLSVSLIGRSFGSLERIRSRDHQ